MAEFDEKLNSILSDPAAMSQIMQLAQSLGGGSESAPPPQQQPSPQQTASQTASGGNPFSALGDGFGLDTKTISRLLPLLQELGGQQDSNARALLFALRPYLKQERQDKVERALQLARLFHIGKQFLAGWGK